MFQPAIPTRGRRLLAAGGLVILAPLFAAVFAVLLAAPLEAQSVGARERRVAKAEEAVTEAETAVEEADTAVEAAEQALEAERQRLADRAAQDPTGHGTLDRLRQAEEQLQEAEDAAAGAAKKLRDKRNDLLDELDKLIKQIDRSLDRPGADEAELRAKLEDAFEDKLDVVDGSDLPPAAKKKALEEIEDEIKSAGFDDDDEENLLRKLRRVLKDVLRDQLDAIAGSEADADERREALDGLRREIEDADIDDDARDRLLEDLRREQDELGADGDGDGDGDGGEGRDEDSSHRRPGSRLPGGDDSATATRLAGIPAPEGSRVVLTGTVVAGQDATLSAIGPDGATLEGVVVEVGGERHVTDRQGRVRFRVGAAAGIAAGTVAALLPGLDRGPVARARILDPVASEVANGVTGSAPVIEDAPDVLLPGSEVRLTGRGFRGDAAGNGVTLGERPLSVLASSPTEIVAGTPADLPVGTADLTVTTADGPSDPAPVTAVRIGLRGGKSRLLRGETTRVTLVVEGTREPVSLRVTNATPQVVRLAGGSPTVETRGGGDNSAEVVLTGITPGTFYLDAEIVEIPPVFDGDDEDADEPDAEDKARLEQEAGDVSSAGDRLNGLGDHGGAADAFERAAELYEEAGRDARARDEHTNAGSAHSSHGRDLVEEGKNEEAAEAYEEAAEAFEKAGRPAQAKTEHTNAGAAHSNHGHDLLGDDEPEAAANAFERAAESFEKAGRDAQARAELGNALGAVEQAAGAARAAGDDARADALDLRAEELRERMAEDD